jgi:hypothetical protein
MLAFTAGCAPKGAAPKASARPETVPIKPDASAQPDLEAVYYVKVWALNLRKCPNTKCRIISVLRKGDQVKALTDKKGWYKVALVNREKSGWVAGRFLSLEPVMPGPRPELDQAPAPEPPSLDEEFSELETKEPDSAPPIEEELAK